MSHYLVDTNIWSEAIRHQPNPKVVDWLRKNERELFVSVLTIGEIKYGIDSLEPGERRDRYQAWLTGLCDRMEGRILSFNTSVATIWGQLRAQSDKSGTRLPTIDSQIAATARRHSLTIATRNQRDFANTDIKTVNPFELD